MSNSLEVFRGIIFDQPNDKVLFVQRSKKDSYLPGHYEFPGGKVDPGEDGLTTLQRELEEETGFIVEPFADTLKQSEIYTEQRPSRNRSYNSFRHITHFVVSRVVGGEFKLSEEHDDFVWDDVNRAPTRGPVTENSSAAYKKFQAIWASVNLPR